MDLKGKTVLVTGGAVRVGKAISLALAGEGANVVINRERRAYFQTIGVDTINHCPALAFILSIRDPKVMAVKL